MQDGIDGKKITEIRAFTLGRGTKGGGDYHDQEQDHWIVGQISTPMSKYPEYRASRKSWGIDALGTVVVEAESNDGTVGFGVSTGGAPAAWLVENHLSR